MLHSKYESDLMSKSDSVCLLLIIMGLALFLYGANMFNAVVGWIGVCFILGGILVFLILYIYREWTKEKESSKFVEFTVLFI